MIVLVYQPLVVHLIFTQSIALMGSLKEVDWSIVSLFRSVIDHIC